jgi:hypothetical protein
MIEVILPLLGLAGLAYAFHTLLVRYSKSPSSSRHNSKHLPVHRLSAPLASTSSSSGIWELERHGITLSASTTALNSLPKSILDKRPGSLKPLLKLLYDAGSALGLMGGGAAILGTIWGLKEVWKAVWDEAKIHATAMVVAEAEEAAAAARGAGAGVVKAVMKRAVVGGAGGVGSFGTSSSVSPGSGGLQPLVSQRVGLLPMCLAGKASD